MARKREEGLVPKFNLLFNYLTKPPSRRAGARGA